MNAPLTRDEIEARIASYEREYETADTLRKMAINDQLGLLRQQLANLGISETAR